MRSTLRSWTSIALIAGCAAIVAAQEPPKADDAVAAQRLEYLLQRLRRQTVHPEGRPATPFRLQEAPVFRWQNTISGADGAVFVWTLANRPVLLTKAHLNEKKLHYVESVSSLAAEKFVMQAEGKTLWTPPGPGIARITLKDVAAPSDGANGRLVQMRAIARRYRFTSTWGEENPSDWELRLLPTPLHRYASDEARVVDGAIFGYAQDTNPEAVAIVEAVSTADGIIWETAPARLSSYAIKAWLDDKLVLDVPRAINTPVNSVHRYYYEKTTSFPFTATGK